MEILYIAIALLLGGAFGYQMASNIVSGKNRKAKETAEKILESANNEKKEVLLNAKDESLKIITGAKEEETKRREYLENIEQKLLKKEEQLEQKLQENEKQKKELTTRAESLDQMKASLDEIHQKQEEELAKVAKLSKTEAEEILLAKVEKDMSEHLAKKVRQMEEEANQTAEEKAKNIVAGIIERYAADYTAEFTVLSVNIPNDEMKGRIIGKEGRNIQAFEKAAGVDLIIDDTPGAVVISSFDSVRRHIAKKALEKLIFDGRIHPARIEEVVEKAKKDINNEIKEAGEKAVYDVGVTGIHPDLMKILGRLKFRTSYGQNQLEHSVEVAKIAGMLAEELNADSKKAKTAALFHDIGKALSQEMGGSHVDLGSDIVRKYGFGEDIINAMESHHEDVEPQSVEAIIVKSADAISASRPGTRRESFENYVKRLTDIENIANSFEGVEKSYAIQAGREVRIIVKPENIDDFGSIKLAHSIAARLEKDLVYPGQIKVNVIRETRAVDYAK
ncbi:ribonuclease Y [Candidatus Microgenomates bacterium]|nr:ribonuclease Y [Candidatus Microgenomates bacterium]